MKRLRMDLGTQSLQMKEIQWKKQRRSSQRGRREIKRQKQEEFPTRMCLMMATLRSVLLEKDWKETVGFGLGRRPCSGALGDRNSSGMGSEWMGRGGCSRGQTCRQPF